MSAENESRESSPHGDSEIQELTEVVRELTRRVYRLEQMVDAGAVVPKGKATPGKAGPSLESRLGAQYLNRTGIVALLVGMSFAVHWAFTSHWIGPEAIIGMGLIGGVAVFLLGEWFVLRRYPAFGVSLQALGLAALYLVLWAGFQIYGVLPAVPALAGMIVITAGSVVTAVMQDSKPLAVFAFLGGFVTPFLLWRGQSAQWEFFVYLIVLLSGMLATLALRPWSSVLLASFFGCMTATLAWFVTYYRAGESVSSLTLVTILFSIFVAGAVLLERRDSGREVLAVIPMAAAAYLWAAYATESNHIGLIEVLVAAGLIVVSRIGSRRLTAVCVTVAIACLALAVPAEFDAHWTTSALWIAMGLVVMFVGFSTRLQFIRWDALVLLGITVVKVFVFDVERLAPGYRILAMVVLGCALLGISFAYQSDWMRVRRQ
jgi:uncharacterized membrane protein